jgi:hypothetical protein
MFDIKIPKSYSISRYGESKKKRKPFKISTKKKEWNMAAGRDLADFKSTSKCRKCKAYLIWGNRGYDFDHYNNDNSNNSQNNCKLLCKTCHGKATLIGKRKILDRFTRQIIGHKTIKKKVGYKKKAKKKTIKKKTMKKMSKNIFGISSKDFGGFGKGGFFK